MKSYDLLSFNIKYLREKSGWTQQKIAKSLNIDRSTYTYYESGKTLPTIPLLIKLSEFFNVPCARFFQSQKYQTNNNFLDIEQINRNYINENASSRERQMLTYFRILPGETQDKIMELLKLHIKNYNIRINNNIL